MWTCGARVRECASGLVILAFLTVISYLILFIGYFHPHLYLCSYYGWYQHSHYLFDDSVFSVLLNTCAFEYICRELHLLSYDYQKCNWYLKNNNNNLCLVFSLLLLVIFFVWFSVINLSYFYHLLFGTIIFIGFMCAWLVLWEFVRIITWILYSRRLILIETFSDVMYVLGS